MPSMASTGTLPLGFIARNSGVRDSPFSTSISRHSYGSPRMSSAMRTLWQLPEAAVPYTVKDITGLPEGGRVRKREFDTAFPNLYFSLLRRFADSLAGA